MEREDKTLWDKIWSNLILRALILILGCALLLFLLTSLFLRSYTRHGKEYTVPNFNGTYVETAMDQADALSFEIHVMDSVYIVGREGGVVISQDPPAGSKVKQGRKIYTTITRFVADEISSSSLPVLYGERYEFVKKKLKAGYELNSEIQSYRYDPGEEDHVLEVYYQGKPLVTRHGVNKRMSLFKGDTLQFVLSKRSGARILIPDLKCKTLEEASAALSLTKLNLGELSYMDSQTADATYYVQDQIPQYTGIDSINTGMKVSLKLVKEKPLGCP